MVAMAYIVTANGSPCVVPSSERNTSPTKKDVHWNGRYLQELVQWKDKGSACSVKQLVC